MKSLSELYDEALKDLKESGQYDAVGLADRNLFDTYILISELLNPENSYDYNKKADDWFYYLDSNNNRYEVRITYDPLEIPVFKMKTYWLLNGVPQYKNNPNNSSVYDWDKRSNTIAKIYRDELVPFLQNQNLTKILIIEPIDSQRYYFSKRLLQKFSPKTWEIIEDFPKTITVKIK